MAHHPNDKVACERELLTRYQIGEGQDGETWACSCGRWWVHICDEAEGCAWWPYEPTTADRAAKEPANA